MVHFMVQHKNEYYNREPREKHIFLPSDLNDKNQKKDFWGLGKPETEHYKMCYIKKYFLGD